MEKNNKNGQVGREKDRNEAGLLLITSIDTLNTYIVAQKITLVAADITDLGEYRYDANLTLSLADGDYIELSHTFELSDVITDDSVMINSQKMLGSVLSSMLADRFYHRMLKTRVQGSRRTIIWETLCTSIVEEMKENFRDSDIKQAMGGL